MSIAAITMVRNEPDYVERWARHYGSQVGFSNCYIIDHSSEDESLDELDQVNILKYPKIRLDREKKAKIISHICSDLCKKYDSIVFTEVDELLFVDPRYFKNLPECIAAMEGSYLNAIGFEVVHIPKLDSENFDAFKEVLHQSFPVSNQRKWICFNSSLCKPSVMSKSFDWASEPYSLLPPRFNHLYLMKLRFSDLASALLRIQRKKNDPLVSHKEEVNIDFNEDEWKRVFFDFASRPQWNPKDIDMTFGDLQKLLWESTLIHENGSSQLKLSIQSQNLWPIADRFRGRF